MPALDCSGTTKLAARPTANTVNEPTNANHGQANRVPNLAIADGTQALRGLPASAARCFTRRVKIPRRKTPRRMPETKEAMARALLTTLSSRYWAPIATVVRTPPHMTVITRPTRNKCFSSF